MASPITKFFTGRNNHAALIEYSHLRLRIGNGSKTECHHRNHQVGNSKENLDDDMIINHSICYIDSESNYQRLLLGDSGPIPILGTGKQGAGQKGNRQDMKKYFIQNIITI